MTNKSKYSLIKKAMKFSIDCKAQVLLFIKYKGNRTIYSSTNDDIYLLHKALVGKTHIQKYSNDDFEKFRTRGKKIIKKPQILKKRLIRIAKFKKGIKIYKSTLEKKKKSYIKKIDKEDDRNQSASQMPILIDESLEQNEKEDKDDKHINNAKNLSFLLEKVNKIIPNTEVPAHILESINKNFTSRNSDKNKQSETDRTISITNLDDNAKKDSEFLDKSNRNSNRIVSSSSERQEQGEVLKVREIIKVKQNRKNQNNEQILINSPSVKKNLRKRENKFEEQVKVIKKSEKSLNSKEFKNILYKKNPQKVLNNKRGNKSEIITNKELSVSPSKLLNNKRIRKDSVDKNNNLSFAWNSFPPLPFPYFSYPPIEQQSFSPADPNTIKHSDMVYLGHQFMKTPGNNIPLLNSMPLFSPLRPDQNALLYYGFPQPPSDLNKN
jgi:hypothetical protein